MSASECQESAVSIMPLTGTQNPGAFHTLSCFVSICSRNRKPFSFMRCFVFKPRVRPGLLVSEEPNQNKTLFLLITVIHIYENFLNTEQNSESEIKMKIKVHFLSPQLLVKKKKNTL